MQLDRDDACTGRDQRGRDRTRPRADVEHQIAGPDGGVIDEAPRGVVRELMPSPA